MKKLLILLFSALTFSLIFVSCSDSTTTPVDTTPTTGSVYIISSPSGAQIFQGSTNTGKVTPDSVTGLSAGTANFTLKLANFKDTTFAATVVAGTRKTVSVTLTSSADLKAFGPIRIYETVGTTASQPSGLDLSAGAAVSVSNATSKVNADLYYYSNSAGTSYLIASTYDVTGILRNTYFLVGSASSLNDHIASPVVSTSSWVRSVSDKQTNYVFVYDNDQHYSKIKYTQGGGSGPGDPSYVDVTWYYNNTKDDTTF